MIIVPELKKVVLLVPRTGSGTLKRAVMAKYPGAFVLYRHMEADGVPFGYDNWERVGVVRRPIERLWSLYKWMRGDNYAKLNPHGDRDIEFEQRMLASVQRPFEDWLLNNQTVFTYPYSDDGSLSRWPQYSLKHPVADNIKSQRVWLRPDLGTQVYKFKNTLHLYQDLGLDYPASFSNATDKLPCPSLSEAAMAHMQKHFEWDAMNAI